MSPEPEDGNREDGNREDGAREDGAREDGARDDADRQLLEQIDASWRPEPLDGAGRARFDARLQERLVMPAGPRGFGWLLPAIGTLAVVALVGWGLRPGVPTVLPEVESWEVAAWEWEVLLGGDLAGGEAASQLPDEYAAIESLFLNP